MKAVRIVILLSLTSLVTFSQVNIVQPISEVVNLPLNGTVATSELGNTLVSSVEVSKYEKGFYLDKDFSWTSLGATKHFVGGDFYLYYSTPKGDIYVSSMANSEFNGSKARSAVAITNNKKNIKYGISIPEYPLRGEYTVPSFLGGYKIKNNIQEQININKEVFVYDETKFKQEFIYGGKVGDNVKFTYREFSDGIARPSFTQDVQYDLTDSKIVGFKGMKLEILEATNVEITYKVLTAFAE